MVNWRREDLARIFSALVLPVDENERLDLGALRALGEMELADDVEGVSTRALKAFTAAVPPARGC